jgi:hypothetical protein
VCTKKACPNPFISWNAVKLCCWTDRRIIYMIRSFPIVVQQSSYLGCWSTDCMRGWAALRDTGRETGHGEGSGSLELSVAAAEKCVHHQAEQFLERRGSNFKSAFSYIFLRFSPFALSTFLCYACRSEKPFWHAWSCIPHGSRFLSDSTRVPPHRYLCKDIY